MKLTPRQSEVIEKMQEGWELGLSLDKRFTSDAMCLLEVRADKERGQSKPIQQRIAFALLRERLIRLGTIVHSVQYYELTDKGKEI